MENAVLWKPSQERVEKTTLFQFQKEVGVSSYKELHSWSVKDPDAFWTKLIEFYGVQYEGSLTPVCTDYSFETYGWFPHLRLNFAENLLSKGKEDSIALNFCHESGLKEEITYKDLRKRTASLAFALKDLIGEGDVLAAYMPNIPETVISMLAATSLGGSFTSTSCDFGIEGVIDRFGQSRPKVLVAAAGYEYNGKYFDQMPKIKEIEKKLDFLEKIIIVDFLEKEPSLEGLNKGELFSDFQKGDHELSFKRVPFDHPLYIMYSSGTTGKPKCIVHSVGGTLLQHIKELGLHTDLQSHKNIFFFTTCGWMMWNWLVSSLYFGSKVTLYEGSPGFPSLKEYTRIIEKEKLNIFGTSPKFLRALEDTGYKNDFKFESLETLMSTGAPLLPEQYDFVYDSFKKDVQLASICGGTDIIGCFMLGVPTLEVKRGEIQNLGLGMDVSCFNEKGEDLRDLEGELVCKSSFPSRPIYFLGDTDNKKIKEAYFNKFDKTWHHGDFITITSDGGVLVYGRSDATLNPGGVRIGTSEIYRQTEVLPYLVDSLCVGKQVDGDVDVILFVKLVDGVSLDEEKILEIKKLIKTKTTPRHIPKQVIEVSDIPYTRSGKKMELLITRILGGKTPSNLEAVSNPECLEQFKAFI
ncbi:MAG: acetoacetyl-CoA synthetase [Bacteriovoracaceae bacterium]